jgi:hypothetical protein
MYSSLRLKCVLKKVSEDQVDFFHCVISEKHMHNTDELLDDFISTLISKYNGLLDSNRREKNKMNFRRN